MRKRYKEAYTFAELLIVISITLIITAASVPSLKRLSDKLARNQSQLQTISLLTMARTIAIQRGKTITYCGTSNGTTCDTDHATSHLLFHDANKNLAAEAEEIIRTEPFERAGEKLKLNVSAKRQLLRFRAEGTAIDWGSITLCPSNGDSAYATHLIINQGGRVRTGHDNSNDGIPENSQGYNVSCDD